ncbi:MAG: hypothetical protein AAGD14_04215 [Planctomycetota bacterium]
MTKPVPDPALAALRGGWVTRERLQAAAARSGRSASPLLKELLSNRSSDEQDQSRQAPPSFADLALAAASLFPARRLDATHVVLAPRAARLLDMELLRRERCVPIEVLDDLCVLAVVEGRAERAVRAVRAALHRDVLPVHADAAVIDAALDVLITPRRAVRRGPLRRRDSPIHQRFRALVLEGDVLDAIERPQRGFAAPRSD